MGRPLEQEPRRERLAQEPEVPAAELVELVRPVPVAFPLVELEALVRELPRAPEQWVGLVLQLERRQLLPHWHHLRR